MSPPLARVIALTLTPHGVQLHRCCSPDLTAAPLRRLADGGQASGEDSAGLSPAAE
jgi:hypothetical protein